jgi:ketosteroid isomerase-like protein
MADDVDWTVEGTHPLAGRYRNKAEQKTEPPTLTLAKNGRLSPTRTAKPVRYNQKMRIATPAKVP